MRKLITILFFLLVSITAWGQDHLKVKGIPIDGNVNTFIAKLKNAGLKYNARYSEALDRTILSGDFADLHNCNWAFLSTKNGTVCKVIIMSDSYTGWFECKTKYNELKDLLTTKYNLVSSFEYFKNPYYEGDGYELSALAQNKGDWQCFFDCDEGAINLVLEGTNSREGYISISYEDHINMAKYTEEREQRFINDI